MSIKIAIVTYYDAVAEIYGSKHGVDMYGWAKGAKTYYWPLIEQFIPRNSAILDIGCGTGKFTGLLKNRSANIAGIDLSPKMVEMARQRVPGVRFVIGDCETLEPFADQTFDVVTAFNTFSYYPHKAQAMASIYRVLKGNGIFFDLDMNALSPIYYLTSVMNRNEMRDWYQYIKESTLRQLIPLFEKGGFEVVHADTLCWIPNALGQAAVTCLIPFDYLLSRLPIIRGLAMRVVVIGKKK